MVIVTGGTISMVKTNEGYLCVDNGFLQIIKKYPNLHDNEFA